MNNPLEPIIAPIFIFIFGALIVTFVVAAVIAYKILFSEKFKDLLVEEKKNKETDKRRASFIIEPDSS